MARRPRARPTPRLKRTTLRNFGGGLNVIDTELNLSSKYSPVFDNVIRFADGSVSPRYGFEMWLKLQTGTVTSGVTPSGTTMTTAVGSPIVLINWTAHPFSAASTEHITLSGIIGAVNGIPADDLNRTHSVRYVTANQIAIVVRTNANAVSSPTFVGEPYTKDNHALGGNIVDGFYFSGYLVIVSDIGEIVRVDGNRVITRIWSHTIANALGGSPLPWRATELVAKEYWSGSVILSNEKDKPLIIDWTATNIVDYMVDPGNANSNAEIPAFDLCKSAFRYFVVHDTETTSDDFRTTLRISSKNTSVVFSGAPSPGDAVDIDISKLIANMEASITGLAVIKDSLMCVMPTASVLLSLGNYIDASGTQVHEPIPVDLMPNFGTSGRRTIVESGNDVFMLDYTGVPSARLSTVQNTIVPERVSQLIEPLISHHLGRLSAATIKRDAFGVYDTRNKSVHFYAPKYDETDIRQLALNPLAYTDAIAGTDQMFLYVRDHGFEVGDFVTLSGATTVGTIDATDINGQREIVGIINEDTVLITVGDTVPLNSTVIGGGAVVFCQPVNDETIGYLYHYVPSLKINSWSRIKGVKLNGGTTTVQGRTYFFTDNKILRYGTLEEPVYGDMFGDFDANWANSTAYSVGDIIRDTVSGQTFKCLVAHTSAASGTFAAEREAEYTYWTTYLGVPIKMRWELPWADFDERQSTKSLRHIHFDANGVSQFTVKAFVDYIYRQTETGALQPVREMQFTAGDSAGFGAGDQPFGGGRRTREQLLWNFPLRFKLLKLRFEADTTAQLRISAVSFMYHEGSLMKT